MGSIFVYQRLVKGLRRSILSVNVMIVVASKLTVFTILTSFYTDCRYSATAYFPISFLGQWS